MNQIFSRFTGYLVPTVLLWVLNRHKHKNEISQKAEHYRDSNVNTIGSAIPVILGRAIIKNPLVSLYGDYEAKPYTEEYGMHSKLDWRAILFPLLITIIAILISPNHVTVVTPAGPGTGVETTQGSKNSMIMNAVFTALLTVLTWLFTRHMGRTTIQKGFKYYLGWQHIICWTGDNIGIKRIWMNVYDSDLEVSTEKGVWGSDSVAWKKDNINGLVAHIDNENMFGGVDEGGGFVGDIRLYFGTHEQGKDPWMVEQMKLADNLPDELKGLTPVYPMYFTAVIPKAYIGKQATIPEMWFEIVNYPSTIADEYDSDLKVIYIDKMIKYLGEVYNFIAKQPEAVKEKYINEITSILTDSKPTISAVHIKKNDYDDSRDAMYDAQEAYNNAHTDENKKALEDAKQTYENNKKALDSSIESVVPYKNRAKSYIDDLRNTFLITERDELINITNKINNFLNRDVWRLDKIADDINPAEAILDILINNYWGCNYTRKKIDIDSLLELGITVDEEGLGISCLINSTDHAGTYINKILEHINGVCYDNPKTGKITFKLIRADYDTELLPIFSPDNCTSLEFTRLDWSETSSNINVSFTDASNKYINSSLLLSDIANTRITHTRSEQQVDGKYFTTQENARRLAQTKLLSAAYPLSSVSIKCNRIAYNLCVGDAIIVNWIPYGIEKQVFRITNIDYASLTSGQISLTAVEDIFGFDTTVYAYGDIPTWKDPEHSPKDLIYTLFMEIPYELSNSLDTYINAYTAQVSSDNAFWHIYRYENSKYKETGTSSVFTPVVQLSYGIEEEYAITKSITVDAVDQNTKSFLDSKLEKIKNEPDTYTNISGLNLICIDKEIISYESIEKMQNGQYMFKNAIRGIYDTLPKKHSAYSNGFLLDAGLSVNNNNPVATQGDISEEKLEVISQTVDDTQTFDETKITNMTTERRSEEPTVMANLQFGADRGTLTTYKYNYPSNTQFSHNILFKFYPKNKFNSYGIFKQTDDSITVTLNENIKNIISISSNDVDMEFLFDSYDTQNKENITTMQLDWAKFCEKMDRRLMSTNFCNITIKTYNKNKNIYSYDSYEKNLYYVTPKIVGIVANTSDVQKYADMVIAETTVVVPETSVSPKLTYNFEDACLIFVGKQSSSTNNSQKVFRGQDGLFYELSTEVYRIDGSTPKLDGNGDIIYDSNGNKEYTAIIHKITYDEEYVVESKFTTLVNNYITAGKYRQGRWIEWELYQ